MLRLIIALSKTSKLSIIHPLEKALLALGPIVICGFANNPIPLIINILVFILIHMISKNPMKIVVKFIFATTLFALLSSITFVFDYGIIYCSVILLKSISGGIGLAFIALTTPIDDILYFGSKNDGLRDVCDIAKSMERFLILIEDEYIVMNKSIKSRSGFNTFSLKVKNIGKMAGLLFINTMRRWTEIRDGINSRCYRGYMPYMEKKFDFSLKRFSCVLIYNFILICLIVCKI
ncbi:CbiQ family ECF transporter T component [Clostridium ganghwense]|uniref:Cobalt ABC transporter permease n=1 Tax=Clostridium ganghwense TaxID=312089 RepID=A0ABT4CUP6_9CLOT|nr:CbiQ family ECF transporter T component [Clostridium ganghwense]MCY6372163.1 cobalt ABC transporter permease [Clostridium ganghwense]